MTTAADATGGVTTGDRAAPWRRDRPHPGFHQAEQLVMAALLLALGVRASLPRGDQLVLVLCLLAAPLWGRELVSSRWAKVVTAGLGAALVAGIVLSEVNGVDHRVLRSGMIGSAATLALLLAATGVVVHATRLLPVRAVGLLLGAGMLADGVVNPGELGAQNPLKFAVLVPTAVILFSLVYGAAGLVQLTVLVAMALVGVVADARAFFGTALVAAVVVLWQLVRARNPRRTWALTAVFLAGVVLAIYNLASALLINGYLGSEAQERSVEQVQTSGSVLLGGRPELSATIALIRDDITGFGFGVVADDHNIEVAKTGMAGINYDPNNGYVDRFMFGSAVELHSVVGDLWAQCGVLGLVLAAIVMAFALSHIARLVASRRHDVLLVFFTIWMLWNLFFSPIGSAVTVMFLTLGLLLGVGAGPRPARPAGAGAPAAELPSRR